MTDENARKLDEVREQLRREREAREVAREQDRAFQAIDRDDTRADEHVERAAAAENRYRDNLQRGADALEDANAERVRRRLRDDDR